MITNLLLKNFKCFENQSFEFGPCNILAGANSAGKSSVLQSLLLIRQSHFEVTSDNQRLILNGELIEMGTARDVLFERAQKDEVQIKIIEDDNKMNLFFKYNVQDYDLPMDGKKTKAKYKSSLFGDNFQYISAERVAPQTSYPLSDYMVRQHRQIGKKGEFAAHLLIQFKSEPVVLNMFKNKQAKIISYLELVEEWLSKFHPGVRIHLDEHSFKSGMDIISMQYSISDETGSSNKYRPANVGFGITYVLPIIAAGLILDPGGIFVVENPEAHLHPRGQTLIAQFLTKLARSGIQIFIETHSDHILNSIRLQVAKKEIPHEDVKILFFQKNLEKRNISPSVHFPKLNENGRIDNWPSGFFDEWDNALQDLILS